MRTGRTRPRPAVPHIWCALQAGLSMLPTVLLRRRSLRKGLATLSVIIGVGVWGPASAQPAVPNTPVPAPPPAPPLVNDWLPSDWWVPEQVTTGRLNPDAFDDLAIVVIRRNDAPEDAAFPKGARALFILYGQAGGRWRRGELVPGLLPCATCTNALSGIGGGINSALFDIQISTDGLLDVSWIQRERLTKAIRLYIGWDSGEQALGLLRDEIRVVGPGGTRRIQRDYRAGLLWVNGEPQAMPARFIPIRDVRADSY
jgi:hypothetical protein